MKSRKLMCVAATTFALVAISLQLAAQEEHPKHHHYKVIDLSLGGPTGVIFGLTGPLNSRGMASSCADTSVLDTNYPNINPYFGSDPYIQHTFLWQDGILVDLGTLPGGTSSCEQWISDTGLIGGGSTNGQTDPLLGVPEVHAALDRKESVRPGNAGWKRECCFWDEQLRRSGRRGIEHDSRSLCGFCWHAQRSHAGARVSMEGRSDE